MSLIRKVFMLKCSLSFLLIRVREVVKIIIMLKMVLLFWSFWRVWIILSFCFILIM